MKLISIRATATDKIPNSESTGGSSTSESIVNAILMCCEEINKRMKSINDNHPDAPWAKRVQLANTAGIQLYAVAQSYSELPAPTDTTTTLFNYFVYAAACSEVEVDILTGEINVLRSELVYDCGISLNPAIDIGQIEGGFIMGIGLYLEEQVEYERDTGVLLTQGTWEYKVPCSKDIPEKLKVTLLENAFNKNGILNSKATGEPPYALATSVYFAVKHALRESLVERGHDDFFQLDIPATVARRQEAACIQSSEYTL
uniref:Aldehyde oxidase/xanthine dehydrogenase second molybdopterin binding domain-containing protein n=1 Tax=Globisporangium ultimum (strain ATCC 200006 / CBS 805.95 / DAOM BR144) TaxID=431595 RepID=K3WQ62_GLOUD